MKHHPDRFSEPEKKQAAKTKFQAISSAYSVLRDGKKKADFISQTLSINYLHSI